MRFAHPQVLWLLVIFPPALIVFFWWSWRKRQKLVTQFIQARLLPSLISGVSPARQKLRLACLVLAVAGLILALARPQWGFDWEDVKQRGLDIVVAIDTSKSMLATDISPNRLTRAKLAALDLMRQAKSDRLGLVAFAGRAFLECPLTIDDAVFRQSAEALDVNTISEGGTAIAEAIDTSLTAFKEGDNYKILVLLTDGEDNTGGALEAAQQAAKAGLRIFTIGVGTQEGELLRIKNDKGGTDYIRDEQGNVVKSHLDERALRDIAGATEGGLYLPLRGAQTMEALYANQLAPLPKSEGQEKRVKQYRERYRWPLAGAILLLLLEMLMPERRSSTGRRTEPNRKHAGSAVSTPKVQLAGAAVALVFLLQPRLASGSAPSALREYKAGDFSAALQDYKSLLGRKGDDPRLQFNAGTAAYQDQQFDEAAKQFSSVVNSPDVKLQELGYYNLGNTLYRLGERAPDPAKKSEAWESALKNYQNTLALNPQEADAKFNYDFVQKKLQELKQQQQQQQNQQKQDQKQNGQQDQQQQAQKDEQSKENQQAQQQGQQQQQQQQQQEQQAESQRREQERQQAQASSATPKEGSSEKQHEESANALAASQMTPQQAQQLLDAQKGDERVLQFQPEGKPDNRARPIKDW